MLDQPGPGFAVGLFEDAGLVEDDGVESGWVEVAGHFVVGDPDSWWRPVVEAADVAGFDAEFGGFADGLLADGEGGDDQGPVAGEPGPFDLLHRFAEAGVFPECGAAALDGPGDDAALPWVEHWVDVGFVDGAAVCGGGSTFGGEEGFVVGHRGVLRLSV